jgi:hypothetical protein
MKKTEKLGKPHGGFVRELYFSVFMLFYSYFSSRWSRHMNAVKGATGVSFIEGLLFLSVGGWVEMIRHSHLPLDRGILVLISLAIYAGNIYMLVIRGHGIAFELEFRNFRKSKRMALYAAAIVVILVTAGIFCLSAINYHGTWVSH